MPDVRISPENIEKDFIEAQEKAESKVLAALFALWISQAHLFNAEEVSKSIEAGRISQGLADELTESWQEFVSGRLLVEQNALADVGSDKIIAGITAAGFAAPVSQEFSQKINSYFDIRGGQFVSDMSTQQRMSIDRMLAYVSDNVPAKSAANYVKGAVGMTDRMTAFAIKKRQSIVAKNLLDGMSAEEADAVADGAMVDYIDGRIAHRAKIISRTETAKAFNEAQHLAVGALAVAIGVSHRAIKKIWLTEQDERVCPICGPLEGQVVGYQEKFGSITTVAYETVVPPIHAFCRCTVYYTVERL